MESEPLIWCAYEFDAQRALGTTPVSIKSSCLTYFLVQSYFFENLNFYFIKTANILVCRKLAVYKNTKMALFI